MSNMVKNIILNVCVSLLITVAAVAVYNYGFKQKIAYIDSMKLYNEYAGKKELEKKYEDQKSRKQAYLDSLFLDLQYIEKNMAEVAKPTVEQLDKYATKKRVFNQLTENFERDNKELEAKYLDVIWQNLNQYIKDYSKSKKYDYVLGANGTGNLMYAKEGNDITKEIIEYANQKYAGK